MSDLPTVPVIVIHLYENIGLHGEALTVCSGDPMPFVHDNMYPKVPRYQCPLCLYFAQNSEGRRNE